MTVLAEGQDEIRARPDRFADTEWSAATYGNVFAEGRPARRTAPSMPRFPPGDHDIVLVRVDRLRADPAAAPLPFRDRRFRRLTII
ncbi:flavin reductase family protein [Rhodococcus jostii]|uniref:Uncharacterized protein n=1 Tax=Rhodococcus jostii TaxID=132919 RepID=A0A1H4IWZ5_RHOJO|nr:flavin reductase family protein [Rhodococcus jostii]SEB38621.1 hypothetical protein SAMN04490220_0615 [Rhodococcus jostii]